MQHSDHEHVKFVDFFADPRRFPKVGKFIVPHLALLYSWQGLHCASGGVTDDAADDDDEEERRLSN